MGLFDDVLEQLLCDPDVSRGAMFGHAGARLGRSFFAIDFHDDLVVKLGRERVEELVAAERAAPFDPSGKGMPMRDWAQVPPPDSGDPVVAWVALAEEAKDLLRD